MEFYSYLSLLTIEAEHQLTTESLRMDVLVVKKQPNVKIDKNIGQIFLGHNVIEYKSPEDSLRISDYNKVFAYTYLYAAQENVDIRDITTTFVITAHPREVFKYLNSRSGLISCVHHSAGIYYVHGEAFPIQIVLTDSLNKADNLWLKALRHDIEADTINMVFEGYKPDVNIEAYLRVLFKANEQAAKEVLKMEGMALEEKLEQMGFVDKARLEEERTKNKEVRAKLEEERAKWVESAKTMLVEGTPPQTISRWLSMPIEDVLMIESEIKKL